ncbi:MAG: phage holin family protein, partial [Limnobacter sp.]|nr:phage holin family protein [Limnobacter sp.]
AIFFGLGQPRLVGGGFDWALWRPSTVAIVIWSVLGALLVVTGSLFVCAAVVYHFWNTHPYLALIGCAVFYFLCAAYSIRKVMAITREERPLFEATLTELNKDRQALAQSMRSGSGSSSREQKQ